MKGRENKGPPSADLLVCFPSRSHLTLMPKPICSPARPSEPNSRRWHHHHHRRTPSLKGGAAQASPLLWAKSRPMGSEITSEPTSPKVTCAGQIKVRPKAAACKNWQSVMEEIERLHNNKRNKKKSSWVEALGFKKDVMQFLACLRRIKFDFRCFGSIPTSELDSDDEEDEDEDEDQLGVAKNDEDESSKTVFSKWYMVLQEEQNNKYVKEQSKQGEKIQKEEPVIAVPPPNALLLMRCRSAPAKSLLEEREEEEGEDDCGENEEKQKEEGKKEKKRRKSLAMVMSSDIDFYNVSPDIAKETWIVGDLRDALSRSRSWKRLKKCQR